MHMELTLKNFKGKIFHELCGFWSTYKNFNLNMPEINTVYLLEVKHNSCNTGTHALPVLQLRHYMYNSY